jgi:hypothetical protein
MFIDYLYLGSCLPPTFPTVGGREGGIDGGRDGEVGYLYIEITPHQFHGTDS